MEREIKFRAWNIVTKKMIDLKKLTPLALNMDTDGLFIPFSDGLPLMQYTGLNDKNGKEIYEGDILKAEDPYGEQTKVFEVEFVDGAYQIDWNGMFNGGESDITAIAYAMMSDFTFEILGNRYESPSLLTSLKEEQK